MCGIFGMKGDGAVDTTKRALKLLEYRGYDSAGIAAKNDVLTVFKCAGRVENLCKVIPFGFDAPMAIGHTRWATHGKVCDENAHPFVSYDGKFAIVHNGILENHVSLRRELTELGYKFKSETDSETIAHLLQRNYDGDVLRAVLNTAKVLKGAFAVAVVNEYDDNLYAIKNKSPLIIGVCKTGVYICSDIRCVSQWAEKVAIAPDNTVVKIGGGEVKFYGFDGSEVKVRYIEAESSNVDESVEGDFMLKEIMEIPLRLRDAKKGYFKSGGLSLSPKFAAGIRRIYLIGCGTAYNSGLEVAAVAREILDVDVIPVIASEFIYDRYNVDGATLAICISQSGETADTIRAAEKVAETGGFTYAVTNTDNSSLSFKCDKVKNIRAGGEYAVASTKAYNCQLVTLTLMMVELAYMRKTLDKESCDKIYAAMDYLPQAVDEILADSYSISKLATEIKDSSAVFFIGRTLDYPTACEGSLKLKEISYIHSEAYPAGELKHGTLALMEKGVTVVAISSDCNLSEKMSASINEVVSRGARVVCVSPYGADNAALVSIPVVNNLLYGITSVVPLQLLAYFTAKSLGRDVDKPRNLAKSVTVE